MITIKNQKDSTDRLNKDIPNGSTFDGQIGHLKGPFLKVRGTIVQLSDTSQFWSNDNAPVTNYRLVDLVVEVV